MSYPAFPDNIGVLLCDPESKLYRFVEFSDGGYGWFEPLHKQGTRIEHDISDFWPLIDYLPD